MHRCPTLTPPNAPATIGLSQSFRLKRTPRLLGGIWNRTICRLPRGWMSYGSRAWDGQTTWTIFLSPTHLDTCTGTRNKSRLEGNADRCEFSYGGLASVHPLLARVPSPLANCCFRSWAMSYVVCMPVCGIVLSCTHARHRITHMNKERIQPLLRSQSFSPLPRL